MTPPFPSGSTISDAGMGKGSVDVVFTGGDAAAAGPAAVGTTTARGASPSRPVDCAKTVEAPTPDKHPLRKPPTNRMTSNQQCDRDTARTAPAAQLRSLLTGVITTSPCWLTVARVNGSGPHGDLSRRRRWESLERQPLRWPPLRSIYSTSQFRPAKAAFPSNANSVRTTTRLNGHEWNWHS